MEPPSLFTSICQPLSYVSFSNTPVRLATVASFHSAILSVNLLVFELVSCFIVYIHGTNCGSVRTRCCGICWHGWWRARDFGSMAFSSSVGVNWLCWTWSTRSLAFPILRVVSNRTDMIFFHLQKKWPYLLKKFVLSRMSVSTVSRSRLSTSSWSVVSSSMWLLLVSLFLRFETCSPPLCFLGSTFVLARVKSLHYTASFEGLTVEHFFWAQFSLTICIV